MATEIGTTLREARTKHRIELTEAEASTKIRIRFLRAMENEEWDVLPGGSYTRGFIRTYALYLGLDGEQLADEYRKQHEGTSPESLPRSEPAVTPRASKGQLPPSRRVPRLSRGAWATLVSAGLIAILVGVALAGGGGEDSDGDPAAPSAGSVSDGTRSPSPPAPKAEAGQVTLNLTASAEVWVCLLDADEEALIQGEILAAGAEEGPFRSPAFAMSFGNGEVELLLNGEPAGVAETPSPVGYRVEAGGQLEPLGETERPTCT